jgi:hypothetical protein
MSTQQIDDLVALLDAAADSMRRLKAALEGGEVDASEAAAEAQETMRNLRRATPSTPNPRTTHAES